MVGLIASNEELRFGSEAHRSEMSSNWPASTNGPMRLPGYHAVTSGASADRKLRMAVLCASRSLMLRLTVMSGLAASKSATTFSNAAFGPGFGSSKMMTSSPAVADVATSDVAIASDARSFFICSSKKLFQTSTAVWLLGCQHNFRQAPHVINCLLILSYVSHARPPRSRPPAPGFPAAACRICRSAHRGCDRM